MGKRQNISKKLELTKEEMVKVSLDFGIKIRECRCKETIPMLSRACDYCRDEQIKDYNFTSFIIEIGE